MPHRLHEAIVALLQHLPDTVAEVLVATGDLPPDASRVSRADRTTFAEAQPVEARPDLVVVCRGRPIQPLLVVEVQRCRVPRCSRRWLMHGRHKQWRPSQQVGTRLLG